MTLHHTVHTGLIYLQTCIMAVYDVYQCHTKTEFGLNLFVHAMALTILGNQNIKNVVDRRRRTLATPFKIKDLTQVGPSTFDSITKILTLIQIKIDINLISCRPDVT